MKNDTATYALHIAVGMAMLVMVFLVFMEPETYDFLLPVIFCTFAVFSLCGSWRSARRSPDRERRGTLLGGAILFGIFSCLGVLAALVDWMGVL